MDRFVLERFCKGISQSRKYGCLNNRPFLFRSFFLSPARPIPPLQHSLRGMYIYICRRGGGDCKQHRTVMCKNAGLYRSLYGSVWFGLVAYKMIYHNSGLTVLKCLNLVRCRCRLRIPSKLYNNNNNVLVLCTRIVYLCSVM